MNAGRLKYLVLLSVAAAVLTMVMKTTAYFLTNSVGLLADAAESLINLFAAVVAFFSLWYASRPVDRTHTYGHEKIEYFSSGVEGTLILAAAAGIVYYAVSRLITGEKPDRLDLGLGLSLGASLVNLAVAQVLLRVARSTGSIVLEADGKHLMTDVYTSVAVLGGLGLVWLTGWTWLDPLVALAVAVGICWTAFGLLRRSFDGLMDHALPAEELALIRKAIAASLLPGTTYHALRSRQAGSRRFVDFHLLVPGRMPVEQAHRLAEAMEKTLRQQFPTIEMTVHFEPVEELQSWQDSELLPLEPPVSGPEVPSPPVGS